MFVDQIVHPRYLSVFSIPDNYRIIGGGAPWAGVVLTLSGAPTICFFPKVESRNHASVKISVLGILGARDAHAYNGTRIAKLIHFHTFLK